MMFKVLFKYYTALFLLQSAYSQNPSISIIEAVNMSIDINPVIERNIITKDNVQGEFLIRKSDFDFRLISNIRSQKDRENLFQADQRFVLIENGSVEGATTNFNLGLQKKFRSGTFAEISLGTRTFNNNIPLNRFFENVPPFLDNHSFISSFLISQPLFRGRGKSIVAAFETGAKINIQSNDALIDFRNTIQILNTVNAYWRFLAANKNYQIIKENENRVRQILSITEDLVKGDKKPESDLIQIKAELSNQERLTYNSKINLLESTVNFGRELGLAKPDTTNFYIPVDDFPLYGDIDINKLVDRQPFIEKALMNRLDLKAKALNLEISVVNLKFFENFKKPQLDLQLFASYGGERFGNGISTLLNSMTAIQGRTTTVGLGLDFRFDLNNNLAKGNYIQSKYQLEDNELDLYDFKRNIEADVTNASNAYYLSKKALAKAKNAFEFQESVFENENIKFQNGMTTLLNLVILQERLTFSELEYVNAQLNYVLAILNLRFETGTIDLSNLERNIFYSTPQ